jgi:hypothetical protein
MMKKRLNSSFVNMEIMNITGDLLSIQDMGKTSVTIPILNKQNSFYFK